MSHSPEEYGHAVNLEDMERACACVNFCRHMPTKAIEQLTTAGIGPETLARLLAICERYRVSDDEILICPACATVDPRHAEDCLLDRALKAWGGNP